MRITGGIYKGRSVVCPPGTIRPAMDRMRESLFSALGDLNAVRFLDLFSGSGVMALEAASRGAALVHSVEKDPRKKHVIKQNLEMADCQTRISFAPVERFVITHQETFQVIFADPPFPYKHKNDLLQKITDSALLEDESLVLIHFPAENRINKEFAATDGSITIKLYKEKTYGRSTVYFYRATAQEDL